LGVHTPQNCDGNLVGIMVSAEDVIRIYKTLSTRGIPVWLTGGWGIDALLGEQTRPHKDLDVIMLVEDVARLRESLSNDGYDNQELWSENRWVDIHGTRTETAFFLRHPTGRELDAHAMWRDEQGKGVPAWEADEGFIFTPQDLAGEGVVGGYPMRCLSPEKQMVCHTGYKLPDKQVPDLNRLHAKFNIAYPMEHSYLEE
jgi:lincosamide nucleotidyltransferase A/C/D/E